MSKNSQSNSYYEVGVLSTWANELIAEYLTELQIVVKGRVHEKIVEFLSGVHGQNVVVLLNKKTGPMPEDDPRPIITVQLPNEPKYKYNR